MKIVYSNNSMEAVPRSGQDKHEQKIEFLMCSLAGNLALAVLHIRFLSQFTHSSVRVLLCPIPRPKASWSQRTLPTVLKRWNAERINELIRCPLLLPFAKTAPILPSPFLFFHFYFTESFDAIIFLSSCCNFIITTFTMATL